MAEMAAGAPLVVRSGDADATRRIGAALGRLAEPGDTVELDGHRLVVEDVDGVRITRLRMIPEVSAEPQVSNTE